MLKYAKLSPDAIDPVRKHPADAGVDVFSLHDQSIGPHSFAIVRTGITFEIPQGYCLQLWPKSRNNHLVGAGILDAGYQGEVLVKVVNFWDERMLVSAGDPVAQLVLVKIDTPSLREVPSSEIHVSNSERGATGGIVNQIKGAGGRLIG